MDGLHTSDGCMSASEGSDGTLVAAVIGGDEAAFRAFFERYFPRIYRFALVRLHGDVYAAKEVSQTTLTRAMRQLASFRGEATLFTWLCRICSRQIVDYLRIHRRYVDNVVSIHDDPGILAAMEAIEAPPTTDPQHAYNAAATQQLIWSVLDRLPERYGDVLEWKYIEGNSVEEIGAKLGLGQIAAQSLLARARTAFKEILRTADDPAMS